MIQGYKVLRKPVRHNGVRYIADDFISESEITKKEAERLIALNAIKKDYKEADESSSLKLDTPSGISELDNAEETVEEILEMNFSYDELKDGAKEQNLTFAGNIGTKKLIALIVEQEKTEYFLSQLED